MVKRIIRSKSVKILSCIMIGALLLSSCGKKAGEVTEISGNDDTEAVTEAEDIVDIDKSTAVAAGTREESVSIKADASGKVKEIKSEVILSDLKDGKAVLDVSKLTDIRNKNGDEEFIQEGDNIFWENKGEDISYEGVSNTELPFEVKVTYFLDDKETSPSDMSGKSGKVKIRFDYKNKNETTVKSEGKSFKVSVPYTFISAVTLDSEKFSNIEVTNGKITTLEGQTMAVGYAFPGLKESLGLDTFDKDINVSDYVEITADAKNFALDFTVTMVTTGIFADIDTASINDAQELSDNMKDLGDSSDDLADAADKLASGAGTMNTALAQYVAGIAKVNQGAAGLRDGLCTLDKNTASLVSGANKLSTGLSELDTTLQNMDMSGGISETDMANLQTALTGLATDAGNMGASIGALQQNLTAISNEVQTLSGEYPDIDTSGAMANIGAIQSSLGCMNQNVTLLQGSLQNISTAMAGMKDAAAGLEQLKPAISQLATASGQLATGISGYGQGVTAAYSGSKQLASGTSQLANAGGQLTSGCSALASGLRSFADGMHTFDEEGIQELSKLAGDDLGTVIEHLKAVKKADEGYTTFSGSDKVKESSVRFVIETEGIEEE